MTSDEQRVLGRVLLRSVKIIDGGLIRDNIAVSASPLPSLSPPETPEDSSISS